MSERRSVMKKLLASVIGFAGFGVAASACGGTGVAPGFAAGWGANSCAGK